MVTYTPTLLNDLQNLKNAVAATTTSITRTQIEHERFAPRYRFLTQAVIWELQQFAERIDVMVRQENVFENLDG